MHQHLADNPTGSLGAMRSLAFAPWNPWAAREMRAVAGEIRPDLAHVHNTWYELSPAVFRSLRQAQIPAVMTLHNYRLLCANAKLFRDGGPCRDCVGTNPWHGVRHRCYRNSLPASAAASSTIALNRALGTWHRDVDLFLALSEFARRQFLQGGLPASKIRVKSNFVADPGLRSNTPSQSPVVVYLGRLSPEKGIHQLLNAWESADVGDLELHLIGDGPLRRHVEERASSGVRVLGRLAHDEVLRRLSTARTLVFPSTWYEGQPMVIIEALASGLPVLGARLGAIPELIEPLGTQWLVPHDQPGAWAQALSGLREDREVDETGRVARSEYEERFTPAVALAELEECYRLVI